MGRRGNFINYIVIPFIIFLFAYFLRRYFFGGFILGDDYREFAFITNVLGNGPNWHDQLGIRFGGWIFNLISFKLFGISETAFFLPTWLMSSSLSVIGYYLLLIWKYKPMPAFWSSLFVASTPFEVLIGTVRANDLFLSWFLALGLLFFFLFEKRPILQGVLLAFFWWLAFYTKLWVVYLFPALGIYYLVKLLQERIWRGLISFSITSFFIHGVTCIVWKIKTGMFFPFISIFRGATTPVISATYPVAAKDLGTLFLQYPKMIFQGSEFQTTLFGYIPYLLVILLLVKIILSTFKKRFPHHLRLDRLDLYLLVYYGSFFLFLNFFPNNFVFDQYYSVPRIFRYLTPLSFPMSLHLAKLVLDLFKLSNFKSIPILKYGTVSVLVFLIVMNIYQADAATKPGQIYRKALLSIVEDIEAQSPPQLLVEEWLGYFMREVYLKAESDKIFLVPILETYQAEEHEQWLEKNQTGLPEGTMLITGLNSFVHYGAHTDGFRLKRFANSLDPHWKLFKEYGILSYLPLPEPARLWRLSGKITVKRIGPTSSELYKEAVGYYDKGNFAKARPIFLSLLKRYPYSLYADTAAFDYAISYVRENKNQKAIEAFEQLIRSYPESPMVPQAYYEMAQCHDRLNQLDQAKSAYRFLMTNYSGSNPAKYAKQRLYDLTGPLFIFKEAMAHYDQQQWVEARGGFSKIVKYYPNASMADQANYFYAITYWRENQYQKTIDTFKQLIRYYPNSPLVPEAYYHIGLSQRALNQLDRAKATYRFLIQNFSTSNWAKFAQDRLKELKGQ